MRAKTPVRARPRVKGEQVAEARAGRRDGKLAAVARVVTVVAAAFVIFTVNPGGDYNQCYQVVMLGVLAAAAAGRGLLGYAPPAAEAGPRPWVARFAVPMVFFAAVLPYLPSLGVGFLSDDYGVLVAMGKFHGGLDALRRNPFPVQFRPLHVFAWWLQYRLWGESAVGYHAVSMAFHGLNAVLVYMLGRRLTGSFAAGLIAGLLFALHPMHTEAVAWISCQLDLQATLLALLSLLCLDQYLTGERPWSRGLGLAGALVAFGLAALTKESPLALPALAGLWTLVRTERGKWGKAGVVVGSYGAVVVGYLILRFAALRGLGGYPSIIEFWNGIFPSAPLRQMLTFFFPLVRSYLGGWALLPSVLALSVFLYWALRNLRAVPGGRLGYYLGFVFLAAAPVWVLPWPSPDLEYSRFAYLPTIGLAWAVGEVCAARGLGWRKAGGVTAVMLAVCAALCVWYQTPWLRAQALSQEVLTAGARMVEEAPPAVSEPLFYVQSLPDTHVGAQVFRNGFPAALARRLERKVLIQTVSWGGDLPPEEMALLTLQRGEFIYEWDPKAKQMKLVRRGGEEVGP